MISPPAEELERLNSRSSSRSVSTEKQGGQKVASTKSSGSIKTPIDNSKVSSGGKCILRGSASASVEETAEPDEDLERKLSVYDPDADLTSFNESLALAAKEAHMRDLYGSRNSKADVDNISSLKGEKGSEPVGGENLGPKANLLKLNKVYDDNGEEVTGNLEPAVYSQDLAFLALSNARLNTRLTSKEEFVTSPHSKAAVDQLHQVNAAWSTAEMRAALDAMNSEEEFDTNLHFSGPRSGPPSLSPSPNVSVQSLSGADLNRNDLNIMPGLASGNTALSSSLNSSHLKVSASPSGTSTAVGNASYMTPKPPADDLHAAGDVAGGAVLPPGAPEKKARPAVTSTSGTSSGTGSSTKLH